jgi:ectoine hydroxylase-related dioxygenase (phytanoyl-CoA dioxygenase family)
MDDRLVYNFHQESNYMKGFSDIINVHYPLLRTSNAQNGTMSILPGTHKLGTLEYQKSRNSKDSYTDLLPKNMSEIIGSFPELHCYLEVGDVILFHKDLVHKSNYNSSALCRPVGIYRLTQSISGDWVSKSPDEL